MNTRPFLTSVALISSFLLVVGCAPSTGSTTNSSGRQGSSNMSTSTSNNKSASTSLGGTSSANSAGNASTGTSHAASGGVGNASGGADSATSSPAVQQHTFHNLSDFTQSWDTIAAQVMPTAKLRNMNEDAQGRFIAQVGTHVFLAGQMTQNGYAIDVLPDHPMTNTTTVTEMLLPYWRVLLQTTNRGLSEQDENHIIQNLGLFNSNLTFPNHDDYNMKRSVAGGVTYQLGFSLAPIFSALAGPDALSRQGYGTEVKFTMVVDPEQPVVAFDDHRVTAYEHQHPLPPTLTNQLLTASKSNLFAQLQSVLSWTVHAIPTPSEYAPGATPLVSETAMNHIKQDLGRYYTNSLVQKMVSDTTYAGMDAGVVQDGSLHVQDIQYGQGRLFILPEPPFHEGEHYYVQNPMYNDTSNYVWYNLATFANANPSVLRSVTVKGSTVTVVLNIKHQVSEMKEQSTMTFSFEFTSDGHSGLKVAKVNVPPYAGA